MTALRPIVPSDRDAFQAFVSRLSTEARIHRFLIPVRELSPSALETLTRPDQARHVALVATEDGAIVGEGRYVALADTGRAEFAIAVADDWQRQGIGARLLGALMAAARSAGLQSLEGEVLRTNAAMLGLMRRYGFRSSICPGDARIACVERPLQLS